MIDRKLFDNKMIVFFLVKVPKQWTNEQTNARPTNRCVCGVQDDSPSYLSSRLAATVVAGAMYERLGRMMGRSYEETVQVEMVYRSILSIHLSIYPPIQVLTRGLKSAESQGRTETINTLAKVCRGLGLAAGQINQSINLLIN